MARQRSDLARQQFHDAEDDEHRHQGDTSPRADALEDESTEDTG